MFDIFEQGIFKKCTSSKAIGCLMLLQMALGLLLNFYYLKPILAYDNETPIEVINTILGVATLLALVVSALNLVFGLLLPKQQIKRQFRTFRVLVLLATAGIVMCANEYAQLSKYVTFLTTVIDLQPDTSASTLELIRTSIAAGRNEAHFLSIFISSTSLLVFYIFLLRGRMIPTILCVFAIAAAFGQLIAVGHTFFQAAIPNIIQLPLSITQLIVPFYLLMYGFKSDEFLLSPDSQSTH